MAMEAPTTTTAPVAGTTAGKYTFASTVPAVTVHINHNETAVGANVYCKFYDSSSEFDSEGAASATSYDIPLMSDGTKTLTIRAPLVGLERIKIVSVWVVSGGTVGGLYVTGGKAGE